MIIFVLIVYFIYYSAAATRFKPIDQFCQNLHYSNPRCFEESIYCRGFTPNATLTGNSIQKILFNKQMTKIMEMLHNKFRNEFACGIHGSFPGAKFMGEVHWNNELAWSANSLAKTCRFGHACPASTTFMDAGQNIVMIQMRTYTVTVVDILKEAVNTWLNHREELTFDDILNFHSKSKTFDADLSSFGQALYDKVNHVGCAMYNCSLCRSLYNYFLVCNYDLSFHGSDILYGVGNHSCPVPSSEYECLCDYHKEDPWKKNSSESMTIYLSWKILLNYFVFLLFYFQKYILS